MNRYLDDNCEVSYLVEDDNTINELIPDRSFIENDIHSG